MKKYRKCPYCGYNNNIDNVLCFNCNKVIDKKKKKKLSQ